MTNAERWKAAISDVENCGFLVSPYEIEPGVFVAGETQGYIRVAKELAERLPGIIIPARSGQLTWINGNSKADPAPHGVLIPPRSWKNIKAARETLTDLRLLGGANRLVYSVGACARLLLQFIAPTGYEAEPSAETLLEGIDWGFHSCTPGEYKNPVERFVKNEPAHLFDEPIGTPNPAYVPAVTLYDVSGYYYSLMRRLPSLRVSVSRGTVKFFPMACDERERLAAVYEAVSENKPLRNNLAGCLAGSKTGSGAFTGSKPKRPRYYKKLSPDLQAQSDAMIAAWKPGDVRKITLPPNPGDFRAAGLLLVRTGYEITRLEALTTNAIYSIIDSVAVKGACRPVIWERHGLEVRVQASGDADICQRNCYHIENKKPTEMYSQGFREPVYVGYGDEPTVYYKNQWL